MRSCCYAKKKIVHGYGLSETVCYSCFLPVDLEWHEHNAWMYDHGFPSIGVPVATLRTWISRLRRRYRDMLRGAVASTVSDPADVEDELRYLYRVLMK